MSDENAFIIEWNKKVGNLNNFHSISKGEALGAAQPAAYIYDRTFTNTPDGVSYMQDFDWYCDAIRSLSLCDELYLVTFKPYDETYKDNLQWYRKKALDACRKKLGKLKFFFIVKEVFAPKEHIHALVSPCEGNDLMKLHKKSFVGKMFIDVRRVGSTPLDKLRTLRYIVKECPFRCWTRYNDYNYKYPTAPLQIQGGA